MKQFTSPISLLVFVLILGFCSSAQTGTVIHFHSSHTSFPDTARMDGHTYDSVFYDAASHYHDSTVLLVIPDHLNKKQPVDLVFWFHGWNNNIDTALEFYELRKQFLASRKNAVLILAETARNAPDSYGGRLEQPAVFQALVKDVMNELYHRHLVANKQPPGQVIIAGHSGAYRVIAYILQNGQVPIQEVYLFDALYSQLDKFEAWLSASSQHRFINWFTNHGGGTDEESIIMMQELKAKNISFTFTEEDSLTPALIRSSRVLFVHSKREHNVIINQPDNLLLLLQNSPFLKDL